MSIHAERHGMHSASCGRRSAGTRKRFRRCRLFLCFAAPALAAAVLAACAPEASNDAGTLRILSYNVQNLFDDVEDGSEYPEFRAPGWSSAHFDTKVGNIARVIRNAAPRPPHVIALQEVESGRALERLQHELGARDYPFRALGCDTGSATRVAVLSRLEPRWLRCHASYHPDFPFRRATLELGLRGHRQLLQLFVVHWKSKLGGAAETEAARRLGAALIAATASTRRAAEASAAGRAGGQTRQLTIVAGDFNERCDEQRRTGGRYRTALRADGGTVTMAGPVGVRRRFVCPWLTARPDRAGSYRYDGRYEPIDHLLISRAPGRARPAFRFQVLSAPFMLDAEGAPFAYRAFRNSGYSDHLPILLTVEPSRL